MKLEPRTILMTGATGYLGSHLLNALLESNNRVILLKRSTSNLGRIKQSLPLEMIDSDREDLSVLFKKYRVDTILHCATNYGRRELDPLSIIDANLILPLKLLKYGIEGGVKTFINTDTLLDKRVSSYSLSKRQFLDWMKTYSDQIACVNVALEHFYGPADDRSKFVSFIIHSILSQTPSIDLTQGEQKRDFIFISDVVSAFLKIMNRHQSLPGNGFFAYEVGSGRVIRIRDVVETIRRLSGNTRTELRFGALPYRTNEVMESKVNLQALKALDWNPVVDLETGLALTIQGDKK